MSNISRKSPKKNQKKDKKTGTLNSEKITKRKPEKVKKFSEAELRRILKLVRNSGDKYKELPKLQYVFTEEERKKFMPIPYILGTVGLKGFVTRWFGGVARAIEAVIESQNKAQAIPKPGEKPAKVKKIAKIASRSDFSKTRTQEEIDAANQDEELCYGNKGFYGTSLPLIPDIRESDVSEGKVGQLLDAFGVSKRFERIVTLSQGPNKRSNRYLVFQYKRLIKSIDGTLVKGNKDTPAHVIWAHDFYRLSAKDSGVCARDRKILRDKARVYWGISNQLLRHSVAFRMALIKKSLGKAKRWFHRDFDIEELFAIIRQYQLIANKYLSSVKVKRVWISQEQRDQSFKWRPLGTSPHAWRIFTRGINNLIETFISGSWPDNQHGYKTGRGVHTVWQQVLLKVIKAKNIFEFDFSGFFNTVRIEAVADTLHRLYVPKYMTAYMVNITSCDVDNIPKNVMLKYTRTTKPNLLGWVDAWKKYEYIHKFRKGYRSRGLPQGFALSPLLSVITLGALDELETLGIKYVIYADDGLFYSDEKHDYIKEAQAVLDKYGVGAYFNLKKSKSVKEDGIWKSKLKLVGLVYDPETDMLSASTRNGATLALKIGILGAFTDQTANKVFEHKKLTRWAESYPSDWEISNEKLIELYYRIYLLQGIDTPTKNSLYADLALQATYILKTRLKKYSWNDVCNSEVSLDEFIYPLVLLRIINRDSYFELKQLYETNMGEVLPYDKLDRIETYEIWTSSSYKDAKNYKSIYATKLAEHKKLYSQSEYNKVENIDSNIDGRNTEQLIKNLAWFKKLDTPPEGLKNLFNNKQKSLELGEWFKLKKDDLDAVEIPSVVNNYLKTHGGNIGYTEITWRNLFRDPVFATFIARLFQDSFENNVVKQNFRLETDRSKLNLVKLIHKYVGKKLFDSHDLKFNIFNSSSYCANMLEQLMNAWMPFIKSKKALKIPLHIRTYRPLLNRIAKRRTDSDKFNLKMLRGISQRLLFAKTATPKMDKPIKIDNSSGKKWVSPMERFMIDKSLFGLYSTLTPKRSGPLPLSFDLEAILGGRHQKSSDRFKLDPLLRTEELAKVGNIRPKLNRKLMEYEIPLVPQHLNITKSHRETWQHLKNKLQNVESLHIKSIARSSISTHEIHTKKFKDPRSEGLYPFVACRWDTLEPKREVNAPFIKKWEYLPDIKNDHPLYPRKYRENRFWAPVNKVGNVKKPMNWMPLKEYLKIKKL